MPPFEIVLTVAFPVFALVAIGYGAGRARVLGSDATLALNAFVAAFALPALLFGLLARARLSEILNLEFAVVMALSMFLSQFAAMALARRLLHQGPIAATLLGLTVGFGNVGYMGIPICLAAFGEAGAWPAMIAVMIGVVAMMPLCVVLIEIELQAGRGLGPGLRKVVLAVLRNPLLLAIAAGLAVSALQVTVPLAIQRLLDLLAAAAGPCALFAIGLFLSDKSLAGERPVVTLAVLAKLLLQPAIAALLVWALLGFDTMWGKAAILLAALPGAANGFILARQYGHFVSQSSAAVFLSTLLSVATIPLLLIVLGVDKP